MYFNINREVNVFSKFSHLISSSIRVQPEIPGLLILSFHMLSDQSTLF